MPEDKPLTKNAYEWKTESVADGWYRLRVTASDEESNPAGEALTAEKISDPIVVDNRRPQVNDLQFDIGNQSVRGRAADALSTIASLEYAIDGDEWTAFAPEDGIFDETEETFEQTLDLEPGPHYLAIRVTDAQGNIGVVHLDVDGQ